MLVICAFAPYLGNYIQPYAFAALYGWVFALASLVFVVRYVTARESRSLGWAGMFIGAAMTCKPEYGLLGFVPAGVVWMLEWFDERHAAWRRLAWLTFPPIAICALTVRAHPHVPRMAASPG